MPVLRKTGVRQPWQPSPLQENSDPLRPTLVAVGAQPTPTAQAQFIGRLPRSEDPGHGRAALLIGATQASPGAVVASGYAPRDQVVAPPDRLSPTTVISGAAAAPQAQAQVTSRPGRDEDTTRLARGATVQVGAQPTPAAQTQATYAPRDQTVVQADRLAPTAVIGASATPFGASVVIVGQPRMADRAGAAPIVIGANGTPTSAQTLWSTRPRDGERPPQPALAQRPADALPSGVVRFIGRTAPEAQIVRTAVILRGEQPRPQSNVLWGMTGHALAMALTTGTIRGPGAHGAVLSPATGGAIEGPTNDGTTHSPGTAGTLRSPKAAGTIRG